MSYLQILKQYLYFFDLFSTPILLKFKNKNHFSTLTSSIISLILLICFGILLIGKTSQVYSRNTISSNRVQEQNANPKLYNSTDFIFAIQLFGMNTSEASTYFDFKIIKSIQDESVAKQQVVPLQICDYQKWKNYGSQVASKFKQFHLNQAFCPKKNTYFQLQGKRSSDVMKFIKLSVTPCKGIQCKSKQLIQKYIDQNSFFVFNFFFLRQVINPQSNIVRTFSFQQSNFFPFTLSNGIIGNVYYSDYKVITDKNLFPFGAQSQLSGLLYEETVWRSFVPTKNNIYIQLNIMRNSRSVIIKRVYLKITDVLSFIGGLFSLVINFLNLIFYVYNLWCFQVRLASNLYGTQEQQQQKNPQSKSKLLTLKNYYKKINFFTFLAYIPYHILRFSSSVQWRWQSMQRYYQAVMNIKQQINVNFILKKIIFLGRVTETIFNQHQINLLHIQCKQNQRYLRKQRQKYKYHKLLKLQNVQSIQQKMEVMHLLKNLNKSYVSMRWSNENKIDELMINQKLINKIDPYIKQKIENFDDLGYQKNWMIQNGDGKVFPIIINNNEQIESNRKIIVKTN